MESVNVSSNGMEQPKVDSQVSNALAEANWLEVRGGLCCGIKEISGVGAFLGEPEHCLRAILVHPLVGYCGYVLFTDATDREDFEDGYCAKYASELADLIRAEGLGEITITHRALNHNSGNMIRAYLWSPDTRKCFEWMQQHYPELKSYYGGIRPNRY